MEIETLYDERSGKVLCHSCGEIVATRSGPFCMYYKKHNPREYRCPGYERRGRSWIHRIYGIFKSILPF